MRTIRSAGSPRVETLPVPPGFSLPLTIRSHGWFDLPPFRFDPAREALDVALARPDGPPLAASISEGGGGGLRVEWHGDGPVEAARRSLRSILRLDQDLAPFYAAIRTDPDRRWIALRGAGRLLRSATVFEDALKLILTTNCSFALTRRMIANLVAIAGEAAPLGLRTFPSAGDLRDRPVAFWRDRVKCGYRAPYLREFVARVNAGAIDPESWRSSRLSSEALRGKILECPGAGPYVAENLLRLLGRADYLALDSWCRAKYATLFSRGRRSSDCTIARRYRSFGAWRGLVLWLDLTRDWHEAPGDPTWS